MRLPVRLQLGGRYHQLARFFAQVSQLPRLISMENILLGQPPTSSAGENEDEVVIPVEVLATTFRRPNTDEAAAAAAAPAAQEGT